MQSRVNLKITFDAQTPEGNPWHTTVLQYFDLPYEMLLQIENASLGALFELNNIAAAEVEEAKKGKAK